MPLILLDVDTEQDEPDMRERSIGFREESCEYYYILDNYNTYHGGNYFESGLLDGDRVSLIYCKKLEEYNEGS